jgi:hypothetical protein
MRRYLAYSLLSLLASAIPASAVADNAGATVSDEDQTVSGVLEQLDLTTRKGLLRTPLGKPIFFDISKPDLFAGISVGQRVTIQLDRQGRAVKAIETPAVPELPPPPQ